MAHVQIEYSANLRGQVAFPEFIAAVHAAALSTGIFPIGWLRTRAYAAEHYRVADGHPDNAFMHIMLRVGHGRDLDTRKRACETIFKAVCEQLGPLQQRIPLGLSLEMQEIDPVLTHKQNNLHEYVKRRAGDAR